MTYPNPLRKDAGEDIFFLRSLLNWAVQTRLWKVTVSLGEGMEREKY
jgi:hypothetical protein